MKSSFDIDVTWAFAATFASWETPRPAGQRGLFFGAWQPARAPLDFQRPVVMLWHVHGQLSPRSQKNRNVNWK